MLKNVRNLVSIAWRVGPHELPVWLGSHYLRLGRAPDDEASQVLREFKAVCREKLFSNHWFDSNIPHLLPALRPVRDAECRVLEIGSWEGRSTLFFLWFLRHAHITAVDTWEGADEHRLGPDHTLLAELEERFNKNIADYGDRLRKLKGPSEARLPELAFQGEMFDVVYVDGSHYADDVLLDALNAFRMLKNEGIIIFDDYLWVGPYPRGKGPTRAIALFLRLVAREVRVEHADRQVVVRRVLGERRGSIGGADRAQKR